MDTVRKECSANEIQLHSRVARLGLAPPIVETDNATFMVMEQIPAMNLADYYTPSIRRLPHYVREQIVAILEAMYVIEGIQYVDITPYNFIEYNGKVWVVDFEHAYDDDQPLHPVLSHILTTHRLKWNKDFK